MGPGGFRGSPPSELNEKIEEPLPKSIGGIPRYLRRGCNKPCKMQDHEQG